MSYDCSCLTHGNLLWLWSPKDPGVPWWFRSHPGDGEGSSGSSRGAARGAKFLQSHQRWNGCWDWLQWLAESRWYQTRVQVTHRYTSIDKLKIWHKRCQMKSPILLVCMVVPTASCGLLWSPLMAWEEGNFSTKIPLRHTVSIPPQPVVWEPTDVFSMQFQNLYNNSSLVSAPVSSACNFKPHITLHSTVAVLLQSAVSGSSQFFSLQFYDPQTSSDYSFRAYIALQSAVSGG